MTETASVDDRASIAEHVRASACRLDGAGAQGRTGPADELSDGGIGPSGRIRRTRSSQRADCPAVCRQARLSRLSGLPKAIARGTGGAIRLAARQARAQSRAAQPPTPVHRSVRQAAVANLQGTFRHLREDDFRQLSTCCATGGAACIDWRPFHRRAGALPRRAPQPCAARRTARSVGHRRLARSPARHKATRRPVRFRYPTLSGGRHRIRSGRGGPGAEIVLVTDQWISPLSRQAKHVLACRVAAPSRWNSSVVLLAVVEALTAAVNRAAWRIRQEEDRGTREPAVRRNAWVATAQPLFLAGSAAAQPPRLDTARHFSRRCYAGSSR